MPVVQPEALPGRLPGARLARVARRALLSGLLALLAWAGCLSLAARWLEIRPVPAPAAADVIIALGGDYPVRVEHAIALYKQGVAPQIWHTGHTPGLPGQLSLAEFGMRVSRDRGVPEQALVRLPSTSTWEDALAVAVLSAERDADSLVIVTSWWHGRRAVCVFRHHLGEREVRLAYAPAPGQYTSATWWQHPRAWLDLSREALAVLAYWPLYGLAPWDC